MKTNSFFQVLVSLVISAVLLTSCVKDTSKINETLNGESIGLTAKADSNINPYAYVGQTHNDALDYIYNHLYEELWTGDSFQTVNDSAELFSMINTAIEDFFITNQYTSDDTATAMAAFDYGIELASQYENNYGGRDDMISWYINNDANADSFTTYQEALLLRIGTAFEDNTILDSFNSDIKSITKVALDSLSDEDAAIVCYATSVAKHSASYWDQNLIDWEDMLGPSNSGKTYWFSWGDVANHDVAGVAGGAVYGLVTGGGVVVAAAAGGASASTYSAVKQVLDHYSWW